MKRRIPLVALLLFAACSAGPDPIFVSASRETHNAIVPEYMNYVNADPALTREQRQRRQATCDRWNEAIRVREAR